MVEPKARRLSAGLRTRIKRLLETDRSVGCLRRSSDPELANYAFFSADPPGRGVEVQFAEYESFALLTALKMIAHGWTQSLAVSILRRARPELETHHGRLLKSRYQNRASEQSLEDAHFLVIITSAGADGADEAFACSVREGYLKAVQWISQQSKSGHGFSMFELTSNAQRLAAELARTEPRRRGQPS